MKHIDLPIVHCPAVSELTQSYAELGKLGVAAPLIVRLKVCPSTAFSFINKKLSFGRVSKAL